MNVTPGFLVLGNVEFKQAIYNGLKNKTLSIQQKLSKTSNTEAVGKIVVDGNELYGCVWLTGDDKSPYFLAVDQKDPKTTECLWDFREDKFVFTLDFDKTKDSLAEYETFVKLMVQFERFLREKVGNLQGSDLIPQEFYGVLEFEYFRQIREFCDKIELAVAIPTNATEGGKTALLALCRVFASDGDQIFYGVVEA